MHNPGLADADSLVVRGTGAACCWRGILRTAAIVAASLLHVHILHTRSGTIM
jgi:hypothetical protein